MASVEVNAGGRVNGYEYAPDSIETNPSSLLVESAVPDVPQSRAAGRIALARRFNGGNPKFNRELSPRRGRLRRLSKIDTAEVRAAPASAEVPVQSSSDYDAFPDCRYIESWFGAGRFQS